ncbi:unnamed protein product, partial [Symbiodinium sp. KB8]
MLAVIDALEALRWAYILLEFGHEFDVSALFDDFIHKARQRPQQLDSFRSYYESASWKLCRELRSGRTFSEAVAAVREDLHLFQEVMSRPPPASGKASGGKGDPHKKRKQYDESPKKDEDKRKRQAWEASQQSWSGQKQQDWAKWPKKWRQAIQCSSTATAASGAHAEDKDLHGAAAQGSQPVRSDTSAPALPSSVIHLDFFSGIGSASLALQRLGVSIRHVMSWEVDEAAIAVARRASRRTTKSQRGSLLDDTPAAAAEAIECIPGGAADLIVITAAAPCPDFSRIRSDNAPGRSGPSGDLFVRFTAFLQALLNPLPGRRACLLAENVLMHNPADTQWFSKQLDAEAVLAGASDYGAIHQPRLWWSWTDWSAVRLYPGEASELKWTKQGKVPQLVLDVPKDSLQDLQPEGLVFHDKILRREILLPCLTTPAIEEGGREAPRNMKGKIDSIT